MRDRTTTIVVVGKDAACTRQVLNAGLQGRGTTTSSIANKWTSTMTNASAGASAGGSNTIPQ